MVLAHFMELTTYIQNMVMLIGLGIAVDYSLLIVHRYREELAPWPATAPAGQSSAPASQGRERASAEQDAIVRMMATAGRAVVFSGTAVAIGLALLLFMPLPFMRGFGIGGLLIPIVSVVCALTLLPVLLLSAPGLDRVRLAFGMSSSAAWTRSAAWPRLARAIMRRPVPVAVGASAALLLLAAPVLELEVGPGTNQGIP